jgi:6-phosphogluconolactonase
MRKLLYLIAAVMLTTPVKSDAADLPLFISAFANGKDGAIHACRLDLDTGNLKLAHRTTDIEQPFFMTIRKDGKFLYAIHAKKFGGKEDEEVAAYQVIDRNGRLKLLNRQSAKGTASCYLAIDATGRTVLVANYSTGSVAALPVRKDGSLGPATSFVQHSGSSIDSRRQKGPYAHSIIVSPNNQFAYAADLGIDKIMSYRLDPATAKLTPNNPAFVTTPSGAGPRHLTFHPKGKHLYAINELKNSVSVFAHDSETGALTIQQTIPTLPDDFTGRSHCADLKITPNGRFLFGTNRGHDSIAAYRIGKDGRLSLLKIHPSLGKGPQNLAITPDGKLLICANMAGDNVTVFRVNQRSGLITPVGRPLVMPKPSCIMLLP